MNTIFKCQFFFSIIIFLNIKKLISNKIYFYYNLVPSIIFSLLYLNSFQKINLVTIDKYKGTYKNIIKILNKKMRMKIT